MAEVTAWHSSLTLPANKAVAREQEAANHEPGNEPAEESTRSRPFSLRLRLILMATAVMIIALAAVGIALGAANQRATVIALRERMESYVYLVLAASEVNDIGQLAVAQDLGDPGLTQPGSGIYAHVHDGNEHWNSPSALGLLLPELPHLGAGETEFQEPTSEMAYFTFRYGIAWQYHCESAFFGSQR